MSPLTRLPFLGATAALVALLLPAPASARHWGAAEPLAAAGRPVVECLTASADGSIAAWRRGDALETATLAHPAPAPVAGPPTSQCPAVATGPGGPVLAVDADQGDKVLVAAGAGAPLTPFADGRLATDGARDESRQGSVALAGGALAIAVRRVQGHDDVPEVVLRRPGGEVATVRLPGSPPAGEDIGPLVGLDAAGRGLVVWGAGRQLLAATLFADGTLGPPRVLAASTDNLAPVRLAVGADGRASAAWVTKDRLAVAVGSTATGIDAATAATTTGMDAVAIQPDGAAIAGSARDARDGEHGTIRIATRAAGRGFGPARTYRAAFGVGDVGVALSIAGGRAAAAFMTEASGGGPRLDTLATVAGPVGAFPRTPLVVPAASVRTTEFVAVAGIAPEVLTVAERSVESLARGVYHDRTEVDAHRLEQGAASTPRVRLRLARVQRLGHPQAVRLSLRCPSRCAIRVAGEAGSDGRFDTAMALTGRRAHQLHVPFTSGGGSARGRPLRHARRVTLQIAIDTPRGELRLTRRVLVRP